MYWTKQPWLLSVELWVVNIACSQKVDASCRANSGREESISGFFVTGTLRNLVLRGESAGHDRKRSSLKNYAECQYGSQNFILLWLRKTQNQPGAAAQSFCLCKVCKYAHLCVSVCKTPSVQVALSELFSKPGHWRGFVTSLQRCLSQIIT